MINHETVAHIFHQRSFDDAATIVGMLARREFDPVYCGRDLKDPRLFFVIESLLVRVEVWVRILLKLVGASTSASRHDEIWVATAHIVRDSTLNRMLRSGRFATHRRK